MKAARVVLTILVTVGVIWLIILLFMRIFAGNNPSLPQPLVNYANTNTTISMYIDGPVVANDAYRGLRITVGQYNVTAELVDGYNQEVVNQQSFDNNPTAYAAFLKSLQRAGFNEPLASNITTDERGICPLKNRFIYKIQNDDDTIKRAWTSTCGTGNYSGQKDLTRQLFLKQIPHESLSAIVRGSGLSLN